MTIRQIAVLAMVVVATQGTLGCATLARRSAEPDDAWPPTLASARALALQSRFDAADSVLARYAAQNPGTRETLETAYWRSVFKLDPSNPNGSVPVAISSLDSYLADHRQRDHVAEATSIRRVAGQVETLSRSTASATSQVKDANSLAANAKAQAADAAARAEAVRENSPAADAEIKRLKDELAKANAELERIRKRLSTPPPKSD